MISSTHSLSQTNIRRLAQFQGQSEIEKAAISYNFWVYSYSRWLEIRSGLRSVGLISQAHEKRSSILRCIHELELSEERLLSLWLAQF